MGVQNLWVLLAPVGRQIEIESLAGKVLAVDASIWLTQFVKAMRDDEGNMIKNAHLIGTFHRVAKLLFYGIKPVFVFDGDTPEIKKRTTARRRRRQENQAANLKQTAQRILINRLKLQREEWKRNGGKAAPAVAPNFVLPEQPSTAPTESLAQAASSSEADAAAAAAVLDVDSVEGSQTPTLSQAAGAMETQQEQLESVSTDRVVNTDAGFSSDHDDADDDLTVDDIVLDTSRIDAIDLQAVFALPPHLQKDMINRILSDRRQEVRDKFIPLAGQPEAYSHTQLSAFLATTALHRRIEAAKRKNREHVEALASNAAVTGAAAAAAGSLGPGQRIASRSDRFFVYKRASDDDSGADAGAAESDSVVHGVDQAGSETKRSSATAGSDAGDDADGSGGGANGGFPLLARFREKKRAHCDDDDTNVGGKMSLSDFSVASMKDFAAQAQRHQARQWAVQSATAAWIAKNEVRAKTEPTLAIEQARRKRLKVEEPPAVGSGATSASAAPSVASVAPANDAASSICILFKPDEVVSEHLALFPASLFEPVGTAPAAVTGVKSEVVDAGELTARDDADVGTAVDDDDVDWEEVPSGSSGIAASAAATPTANVADRHDSAAPSGTNSAVVAGDVSAAEGGADDEDDVEWEDVSSAEPATVSTSPHVQSPRRADSENQTRDAGDEETQDALDDNDEMYLTLKSELEDAKAQDDLEELRGEALKSALATASNLTQWAAGAVRRALAAHSLQHKQFVENEQALAGYASPLRRGSGGNNAGPSSRASPHHGSNSSTPVRASALRRSGVSLADAIEIVGADDDSDELEETKSAEQSTSFAAQRTKSSAMNGDVTIPAIAAAASTLETTTTDGHEDADEQLQQAITNSMREDAMDAPHGSRYLQYATPSALASPSASLLVQTTPPPRPAAAAVDVAALESEQLELKRQRNRQMRDVEGFSDDMVEDVMELLRLFGVPFLVCPMEAEAQCAALEQLGLVDGIITDDSDIFPFGGRRVYKNIFHHQRFVEAFYAADIERELGFTQDELIALALLLGSDYTDGIRGIGIVNATEVVTAYPGVTGLRDFKAWVQAFDLTEEAQRVADKRSKKSDAEVAALDARARFEYTHASARRKWELGDEFPNAHVVRAYTHPQVDRSDARFSWSLPDLAALRTYTARTFGWDQPKADGVLLPLVQKASIAAAARGTQTRIDQFFRAYDDEVRYAKIQSKRLRSAVEGRAQRGKSGNVATPESNKTSSAAATSASSSTSSTAPLASAATAKSKTKKSAVAKKKKTTLTALGFGQ